MERASSKIKKLAETLTINLERTPDILNEVSKARQNGLLVIGFAAETDELLKHSREKLEGKHLDAIIANDITQAGAGFDTPTNIITILTRASQTPIELPLMSKLDASHRILDEVARLRSTHDGR